MHAKVIVPLNFLAQRLLDCTRIATSAFPSIPFFRSLVEETLGCDVIFQITLPAASAAASGLSRYYKAMKTTTSVQRNQEPLFLCLLILCIPEIK